MTNGACLLATRAEVLNNDLENIVYLSMSVMSGIGSLVFRNIFKDEKTGTGGLKGLEKIWTIISGKKYSRYETTEGL